LGAFIAFEASKIMTDAQRKDAILLITGPGSCYVGAQAGRGKSQVAYELARALRILSKSIG
jgi:2-phosphoglycerate kinase